MDIFCLYFGIRHTKSSPYYPQGDAMVERLFGTVKPMLKILSQEHAKEWDEMIPFVEMAVRNTQIKKSLFTPSEVVFGRHINCAWNLKYQNMKCFKSLDNYVKEIDTSMKQTHEILRRTIKDNFTKQKKAKNGRNEVFIEGEKVLIRTQIENNPHKF